MGVISEELKWVWQYLWKYPLMSTITIVFSVIEIVLFSMPSLYIAKIVDLFLTNSPQSEVLIWLGYMLGTSILQSGVFYLVASINEILAHRVTTDMTADLFTSLQERPLYYHDQVRIGDVMARATGDTRTINIGLSPAFRILWQIFAAFIFIASVLVNISWKLTMILIIAAPLFLFAVYRYGIRLEPLNKQVQDRFGDLSIYTAESIAGIRELKSYSSEDMVNEKFTNISKHHASAIKKEASTAAIYIPGIIMAVTLALTTLFGVYLILQGELSISGLVAFTGLLSMLLFIARRIGWVAQFAARTNAAARRLRNMLFVDIEPIEEGTKIFTGKDTTIEFDGVWFSYMNNGVWALKGVNVTINHGETIAIVGGPGAGKSTINKMILHLYEPNKGEVRIGGDPLYNYTNESIRKSISSIEQDIFLFSESIRKNIAFGKPSISDEEIIKAAKIAKAHEFIMETENGYDTQIGERGVRLSGGQKQRIAIARALIMDPAILIMDDASSALDAETEMKIQEAISGVLKTRTSIITTHRLSIIAEADRVLLLEKGRIIADGSHERLIKTEPEYRKLFEGHYHLPPMEPMQKVKK